MYYTLYYISRLLCKNTCMVSRHTGSFAKNSFQIDSINSVALWKSCNSDSKLFIFPFMSQFICLRQLLTYLIILSLTLVFNTYEEKKQKALSLFRPFVHVIKIQIHLVGEAKCNIKWHPFEMLIILIFRKNGN